MATTQNTGLLAWADAHRGSAIIVCGCGPSLPELKHASEHITIGVNDVGRLFDPTYLVVVNPRSQFKADRLRHIESSNAQAVFTQLELGRVRPPVVHFKLGRYAGTGPWLGDALDYTQNSPYVAVCLAAFMGATRIGLIGVDFTDDHFFAATGRHPLARRLPAIDREYGALAKALASRGVELVNLSERSRLTSLRKATLDEFDHAPSPRSPPPPSGYSAGEALRIVSYATTPVAGVPELLARCIDAETPHRARCVWPGGSYGNGVAFAGGLCWGGKPTQPEVMAALDVADLVIVHNGKVDPAHARLLRGKPLLTVAHNYGWNVDMQHVQRGQPGVVVGQYQATLAEFEGWGVVPNPIPLREPEHAAGDKGERIRIVYTPSGRHERYPEGHRLYWHGKGWETTMAVLARLARLPNVIVETTEGGQVGHAEALAMKRRAHIVIDECVTGSYHRNSLEGLAAAAVVVNGVGLLPGVEAALQLCAPSADTMPFVFSCLDGLERTLHGLIDEGGDALVARGRRNRDWMERHWRFADQWQRSWAGPCRQARAATRGGASVPAAAPVREPTPTPPPPAERNPLAVRKEPSMTLSVRPLVTVVVPHGGVDRLPQLTAALAGLRRQTAAIEIVVVEMGTSPVALECARRHADAHVFIEHAGAFERALALNAGQALANGELVLWLDNDMLLPAHFIESAARELVARKLDFLAPYTAVRYLSAADSTRVMQGIVDPAACRPVNVLASGTGASGGIGLVRRAFLERHGGLVEGFRGWGGEDNAWMHKVGVLGSGAATRLRDQEVHHLHHAGSGGQEPGAAGAANPHYSDNVALMAKVCALRRPTEFAASFPPASPASGDVTRFERGDVPAADTVWAYWEGPCPAWIQDCLRTLAQAAPTLRVLTAETFDRLRDRDRDIDLSRLRIAHRADFVRMFLLHRYGGLWVDADCLAMKPLQPVLDLLRAHETVGHRERSGLVSNGFIAARPGSRIVGAVYRRQCDALRARRPLGWTTLGSEPLTAVIAADDSGWHELPCQRVQPVCWSEPAAFFTQRPAAAHAERLDGDALCYMLSNTRIAQHQARHQRADIRHRDSFFTFLRDRALGVARSVAPAGYERVFSEHATIYRGHRDESISGPGSGLQQTAVLRERLPLLLAHLGVRTLLDAPCGDFHWMQHVATGVEHYIGADILADVIAEHQWRHARADRRFLRLDLLADALPRADAVFCRDLLPHLTLAEIAEVLRNVARSGATYLLTTTFTSPRPNTQTAGGRWRPINLTRPPFALPPPLLTLDEGCSEAGGAYADKSISVWRVADLSLAGPKTSDIATAPALAEAVLVG